MSIAVTEESFKDGVPEWLTLSIRGHLHKCCRGGIDPEGNIYLFDGEQLVHSPDGVKTLVRDMYNSGEIVFTAPDHSGRPAPGALPIAMGRMNQIAERLTAQPALLRNCLRPFESIVRLPQVKPAGDGFEQCQPGISNGQWYTGKPAYLSDVDPTYPHLHRWFSGVRFTHPEPMLGNLLGWYVATLARVHCSKFPFLMIDAKAQDNGKTTVAEAMCYGIRPDGAGCSKLPPNEDKQDQLFATEVGKPGPVPFLLDNLGEGGTRGRVVHSSILAQIATGRAVKLRHLYCADRMPLHHPIVVMTMNNATLSRDLASRIVHVRVDNGNETRVDPYPPAYAEHYKDQLQAEAVHLLCNNAFPRNDKTRFFDFHRVAAKAADCLGLPCDFSPTAFSTTDAIVLELYSIVRDRPEPMPLVELVGEIHNRDTQLIELRCALEAHNARSVQAEVKCLLGMLLALSAKDWVLHTSTFRFVLDVEHGMLQAKVSVKENVNV